MALNDLSDIVGYYACAGEDRAFVAWNAGPVNTLSLPNQYWSRAYGVNSKQEITGTVEDDDPGFHAFLYTNGQTLNLGYLPGHTNSEGYAINEAGIVVGFTANTQSGPVLAARWVGGVVEALDLPPGPSADANDINDIGQIVGYAGGAPGPLAFTEAFLWENGKVTFLGIPPGGTYSKAEAISNNGAVCGLYRFPGPNPFGGDSIRHALAWIDDQMIDLGVLSGFLESQAYDIDDQHMVVGRCWNNFPATSSAFIWRDGVMTALDDLLAPEFSGYQVSPARAINNIGQIAADVKPPGSGRRAALLTPVPPQTGDTNCDWLVNVDDLLGVINAWGPDAAPPEPFSGSPDLDANGSVNVDDLLLVIQNWS